MRRQAWIDSGKVYGYRKSTDDRHGQGQLCSGNRVARFASLAGIAAQIGYKGCPGRYGCKTAVGAGNTLDRKFEAHEFEAREPDTNWVTDITYIKMPEGWSYLAVVIDPVSRWGVD